MFILREPFVHLYIVIFPDNKEYGITLFELYRILIKLSFTVIADDAFLCLV